MSTMPYLYNGLAGISLGVFGDEIFPDIAYWPRVALLLIIMVALTQLAIIADHCMDRSGP